MIGTKSGDEEVFHYFHMHELIPDDYILKRIDRLVDFSFVHEWAQPYYSDRGRPSVDPEVMARMLLIGYLFGIRSERQLCQEVSMHLGYRWFAGLNMNDNVPDHSTFSKNRHGRFKGGALWEHIFDEVVLRCIAAGLVCGKRLSADGSLVEANASMESLSPIVVETTPKDYLSRLEMEPPADGETKAVSAVSPAPAKEEIPQTQLPAEEETPKTQPAAAPAADGEAKISNDTHRSLTDADARIAKKGKTPAKLCHQVAYVMDNKSRVILDVSVGAPGARSEMDHALTGLDRAIWRYRLPVEALGADGNYAAGGFLANVYDRGVTPYVPMRDMRGQNDKGIYPLGRFFYDEEFDRFLCPRGCHLKFTRIHKHQRVYRASQKNCNQCPVKAECTRDASRTLRVHVQNDALEKAKKQMTTREYRIAMKYRKSIEALFGEAKEQMGMRRMKFRGRGTISEQAFLTAAAQNIKRLIRFLEQRTPRPATSTRVAAKTAEKAFFAAIRRHRAPMSLCTSCHSTVRFSAARQSVPARPALRGIFSTASGAWSQRLV
jgi:transposase